jgi:hypothetical protein
MRREGGERSRRAHVGEEGASTTSVYDGTLHIDLVHNPRYITLNTGILAGLSGKMKH